MDHIVVFTLEMRGARRLRAMLRAARFEARGGFFCPHTRRDMVVAANVLRAVAGLVGLATAAANIPMPAPVAAALVVYGAQEVLRAYRACTFAVRILLF